MDRQGVAESDTTEQILNVTQSRNPPKAITQLVLFSLTSDITPKIILIDPHTEI